MTTALTEVQTHAPAAMSREQVDLIKDTIARDQNLTDNEFRLFLYTAQRLGLDPLARQLYAIRRQGKITFQTGIDGYRLCAARTGQYAGSDEPVFEEDGQLYPAKAAVTVWRIVAGVRCPFTASARWEEYYPGEGGVGTMWRKMPRGQLAKCAEALALRKAFPAELSGVYTDDEMQQADRPERLPHLAPEPREPEPEPWSAEERGAFFKRAVAAGLKKTEDAMAFVAEVVGKTSAGEVRQVMRSDIPRLDAALEARRAKEPAA